MEHNYFVNPSLAILRYTTIQVLSLNELKYVDIDDINTLIALPEEVK